MDNWQIECEVIDRKRNLTGSLRSQIEFKEDRWTPYESFQRDVKFFSIARTVPPSESHIFALRKKLQTTDKYISTKRIEVTDSIKSESAKILGKAIDEFELYEITYKKPSRRKHAYIIVEGERILKKIPTEKRTPTPVRQLFFIGRDGNLSYSELNFGAGESSVLRIVSEMETVHKQSLVLIEEIENGLHPLAVRRMTDYLIDTAHRKGIQVIFTTHSDYALTSLPPEAVWSCLDGKTQQGKLSVEVLRAVSGRIDKKLAVFVEDEFSKAWLEAIAREFLSDRFEEIGIYPLRGDGTAVKIHLSHNSDPSVTFRSMCFLDGDSKQQVNSEKGIYRLPGERPELTVFNSVLSHLETNVALLTIACQRSPEMQGFVTQQIRSVSITNRDPHLLFSQVGVNIGFVPEIIVRGAFLSIWIQENRQNACSIAVNIRQVLDLDE